MQVTLKDESEPLLIKATGRFVKVSEGRPFFQKFENFFPLIIASCPGTRVINKNQTTAKGKQIRSNYSYFYLR